MMLINSVLSHVRHPQRPILSQLYQSLDGMDIPIYFELFTAKGNIPYNII